jgi:acyl carrier protein
MSKSCEEIEQWLVSYLSRELKVPPSDLPLEENLTNLGVTSRQAIVLTGELEEWLGKPVDPAVAWEHPTIRALAAALAQEAR